MRVIGHTDGSVSRLSLFVYRIGDVPVVLTTPIQFKKIKVNDNIWLAI